MARAATRQIDLHPTLLGATCCVRHVHDHESRLQVVLMRIQVLHGATAGTRCHSNSNRSVQSSRSWRWLTMTPTVIECSRESEDVGVVGGQLRCILDECGFGAAEASASALCAGRALMSAVLRVASSSKSVSTTLEAIRSKRGSFRQEKSIGCRSVLSKCEPIYCTQRSVTRGIRKKSAELE